MATYEGDEMNSFGGPLGRSTAVVEVARRILAQVSSGQLGPGSRLPSERQLAAALEVGRSTVREALAALDLLGIIGTRQGAGSYIKAGTSDLLPQTIEWGLMLGRPQTLDLVEARRHIEIINAELAAARASTAGKQRLKQAYEAMVSAAGDPATFVDADVAFHFEVATLAGNSVLSGILTSIRALLHVWVTRATTEEDSAAETLAEHRRVMESILGGDSVRAREAMTGHMDRAGARLSKWIEAEVQGQQGGRPKSAVNQ